MQRRALVNYEKIVTDLKVSVKNLIDELKNIQKNYTSEIEGNLLSENALLREQINSIEKRFHKENNFVRRFEKALSDNSKNKDTLDFVI